MSGSETSPFQANPPSAKTLWRSVLLAVLLAGVVLIMAVLPAEYGIDPTGIGARLGLTQMSGKTSASIQLTDTLAGNAQIATGQAQIADAGEPLPLPNPAVSQVQAQAPKHETLTIELPAFKETEVKTVLKQNQVVLYAWHTNKGLVYVDYHGHSPEWQNKAAFVRYQEAKEGIEGANGSLVAPFAGEHGWYWVNLNEYPVTITLEVSGYYDELKNYGIL